MSGVTLSKRLGGHRSTASYCCTVNEQRSQYINALRQADAHNLEPLLSLFQLEE